MRLIDADALKGHFLNGGEDYYSGYAFHHAIDHIPTVDAVPVVRCKDCKHRPTRPEEYDDGFDLAFPDEVCPCYCDDDPFYSWYPKDDWFCPNGEGKGGDG